MRISIIIPTTDLRKSEKNGEFLRSQLLKYCSSCELIFVVDGSKGIDQKTPEKTVIYNSELRGSYFSRNRGASMASGERLLFCDDGVEVSFSDSFSFEKYEGKVFGSVVSYRGVARDRYEWWYECNAFVQEYFLKRFGFLPTIFLSVDKKDFDLVGGFDAALMSSGDVDFSHRISEYSEIVLAEDVVIKTDRRGKRSVFNKIKRQTYGHCHKAFIRRKSYLGYYSYVILRLFKNILGLSGHRKKDAPFGVFEVFYTNFEICFLKSRLLFSVLMMNPVRLEDKAAFANKTEVDSDK